MDKLEVYRQAVQQVLTKYGSYKPINVQVDVQTIFDTERDHYQLVYVGWRDSDRFYGVILHADIIDDKIWIQQDGTEQGLANQLVELGVPKHDIVLAFDPPNLRKYTDFAVQ